MNLGWWTLWTACTSSGLNYATSANSCATCPDTGDCAVLCDIVQMDTATPVLTTSTGTSSPPGISSSSDPTTSSSGTSTSSSTAVDEPLEADSCAEASALASVVDGTYEGTTLGYADDLNPLDVCLTSTASGPDVFYPVDVGPQEILEVVATGDNPIVYVITDCSDETSCVAGVEAASPSTLVWFNPRVVDTQSVFVVVDAAATGGAYTLDIQRYPLVDRMDFMPADQCTGVLPSHTLMTGSYSLQGDLSGFTNDMTPAAPSCTGYAAQGSDAFIPFHLEAGESLTANYRQENDDGSLYYLDVCGNGDSCVVGADNTIEGQVETLSIINPSGGALDGTLVLDNYKPPGTPLSGGLFQLDVVIE